MYLFICVQGAIAPTRACAQSAWRFSFGVCHEGLRHIYPHTEMRRDEESCEASPLFNVSCHKTCPAGTHLAAKLRNGLTVLDCVECKPGYFSLGGGLLISGRREIGIGRGLLGSEQVAPTDGWMALGTRMAPARLVLRLGLPDPDLSPPTVAGAYYIRATHTRSKGTRSPPGVAFSSWRRAIGRLLQQDLMKLAPAGQRLHWPEAWCKSSGQWPPQPEFLVAGSSRWLFTTIEKRRWAGWPERRVWWLAPAAILDIGAGPHGPPEHSPGRDTSPELFRSMSSWTARMPRSSPQRCA